MDAKQETGIFVDLLSLLGAHTHTGPQWSHESDDLDLTLIRWATGQGVAPHRNDEVDVVLVVVDGAGEVKVDGRLYALTPGHALLIPKGAERAIRCIGPTFSYLSLHRARPGAVVSEEEASAEVIVLFAPLARKC